MSARAKNRPVSVNRRKLLQATLASSALASVGGINRVLASNEAPYHFSRTPAFQEGTTISVLVPSFQAIGDGFMRDQAAAFGEETGIQVDMQFLPFEKAMDRQTTLVAAKSGEVDVFGTHYAQIGKFGEGMVPLNDLAAENELKPEDYVSGSFDALSVDGKLLAIPFTFDLRTLFYRTDLFEAAGIEEPPATWDEFVATAQKVNNPPDVYGFITVGKGDPVLREYSDRLWENGGDFLENGLEPSPPAWNQPAGVEALTWMRDLIWEYKIAPEGTPSYGWEENAQLFAAGQGAMSKQWSPGAMEDPQQSAIIGKYAVAPLTSNKTSRTTAICHARGINLFSEKQDAAWEYVKYVTSPEQLLAFFHGGGGSRPAQLAALEQARESAEGVIKQNLEISLEEANDGYTWPLFAQFTEVQPILWGEIEKVLSRQKEPQEALDFAAEQATEIFKRDGLI
ncbi:MAG TPA: sugar ABC transporter substrate-binding protein [Thermomicrobiales bacterium]|jgi:multiple sugar transport system substrate-binding protein|nr:sugar ABC transporter substrate-binding protein [Thermomicrobiales bacterium]